jgi:hypothetical protein
LYYKVMAANREGLIRSSHDLSDGGLAVALAETTFGTGLGLRVAVDAVADSRGGGAVLRIAFAVRRFGEAGASRALRGDAWRRRRCGIGETIAEARFRIEHARPRAGGLRLRRPRAGLAEGAVVVKTVRALVLTGFGINCQDEMAAAYRLAGAGGRHRPFQRAAGGPEVDSGLRRHQFSGRIFLRRRSRRGQGAGEQDALLQAGVRAHAARRNRPARRGGRVRPRHLQRLPDSGQERPAAERRREFRAGGLPDRQRQRQIRRPLGALRIAGQPASEHAVP